MRPNLEVDFANAVAYCSSRRQIVFNSLLMYLKVCVYNELICISGPRGRQGPRAPALPPLGGPQLGRRGVGVRGQEAARRGARGHRPEGQGKHTYAFRSGREKGKPIIDYFVLILLVY